MSNPLQSASLSEIDFESLADYIANSLEDDDSPLDSIQDMELGISKSDAKSLIDSWFKIDPKKRLSITLNKKQFDSWLQNQLSHTAKKPEANMGKVKALKTIIEALNKSDLEAIEAEVHSSFEPDELAAFKTFDDFFDAVDVQNGYEPDWKPKKWKPYYKAVYDKIKQGNK